MKHALAAPIVVLAVLISLLSLGPDNRTPTTEPRATRAATASLAGLPAGTQVQGSVRIRLDRLRQPVRVHIDEWVGSTRVSRVTQNFRSHDTSWHRVSTTTLTRRARSTLTLRVETGGVADGATVSVDEATLRRADQPAPAFSSTSPRISNGCPISERGVPLCSAYLGGAYGSNSNTAPWERFLGRPIGVHRTFYQSAQVSGAIRTARSDLAHGRLPWISFKMPKSWQLMALGLGDAWVRNLSERLARLDGPVWLAFHHEPEYDGNIAQWTAMQRRLAPLVRRLAPNVAYSIILTGYNQVDGPAAYRLASLWPDNTTIDVVGFDIYNQQGVVKDGRLTTKRTPMQRKYFRPLSRWASQQGVAWALAETGYTARAARRDPQWVLRTYQQLLQHGGVAMSYFNTNRNSIAEWALNTDRKARQFRYALKGTPRL